MIDLVHPSVHRITNCLENARCDTTLLDDSLEDKHNFTCKALQSEQPIQACQAASRGKFCDAQ
jgi:hypothetical protein